VSTGNVLHVDDEEVEAGAAQGFRREAVRSSATRRRSCAVGEHPFELIDGQSMLMLQEWRVNGGWRARRDAGPHDAGRTILRALASRVIYLI